MTVLSNYYGTYYDGTISEIVYENPLEKLDQLKIEESDPPPYVEKAVASDGQSGKEGNLWKVSKFLMKWTDKKGNSDTGYPDPYECLESEIALDIVPPLSLLKVGQKVLCGRGSYQGSGGYDCPTFTSVSITDIEIGPDGRAAISVESSVCSVSVDKIRMFYVDMKNL